MKAVALAALFAAGILLAGALTARGQGIETTTETITSTVHETTTEPGTTVVTTATVESTTPTAPTTTAGSSSNSGIPTWVWVLLAVLAAAIVGLVVALLTRSGTDGVPPTERRRRLDNAVATWAAQGWAVESQSSDSAVLQRGMEQMVVSVDNAGQVSARPIGRP
jgi:hypothetical protein